MEETILDTRSSIVLHAIMEKYKGKAVPWPAWDAVVFAVVLTLSTAKLAKLISSGNIPDEVQEVGGMGGDEALVYLGTRMLDKKATEKMLEAGYMLGNRDRSAFLWPKENKNASMA